MDASIVIVCFNPGSDLGLCIESLGCEHWREVILVDNASSDGSVDAVAKCYENLHIIYSPTNRGFAGGANLGARHASGSALVFLNPDTFAPLSALALLVERVEVAPGVAGPLVHRQRGQGFEAGAVIDILGMPRALPAGDRRQPMYVSGCCLATSRTCFDEIGGFDERYFMFMEDVEYCWQALRRDFAVSVVNEATVEHVGGRVTPGGYRAADDDATLEMSAARVLLRERNTTTMILACAPVEWLPLLLLGCLIRTVAFAGLLIRLGDWRSVGGLATGVGETMKGAPGTLHRRRRPGITRQASSVAWSRVVKRLFMLDHLSMLRHSRLVGARGIGVHIRAWEDAVGESNDTARKNT